MGGDVGRTQERLNRHKEAGECKVLQPQVGTIISCSEAANEHFDHSHAFISQRLYFSANMPSPRYDDKLNSHSRFHWIVNSHCSCTKTPEHSAQETGDSRGDQERRHGDSGCTWSYCGVGLVRAAL